MYTWLWCLFNDLTRHSFIWNMIWLKLYKKWREYPNYYNSYIYPVAWVTTDKKKALNKNMFRFPEFYEFMNFGVKKSE